MTQATRSGVPAPACCRRSPARRAGREASGHAFLYINVRPGPARIRVVSIPGRSAGANALPALGVFPAALVDGLDHQWIRRDREHRSDDPVGRLLPLLEVHVEADQLAGVLAARRGVEGCVFERRLNDRLRGTRPSIFTETDHREAAAS